MSLKLTPRDADSQVGGDRRGSLAQALGRNLSMSKSEIDFQASIKMLRSALRMYYSGKIEAYLWIAIELRKLICDKDALLPRVRPNLRLHKLHWTELLEQSPSLAESLEMMMPGRLHVSSDGVSRFELLFAKSGELLSPKDWVNQPMFSPSITIWELVKSVADKEAAHSDPEFNETLVRSKMVKYAKEESHVPAIVALGDYIYKWLYDLGSISA